MMRQDINEREYFHRIYYRNGQLQAEGMVRDSLKDGLWKTYYSDGELDGELLFSKGEFVHQIIGEPVGLQFNSNDIELKAGHTYQFRIRGVPFPEVVARLKIFGEIKILDDRTEPFRYEMTPRKAGTDTLWVILHDYYSPTIQYDNFYFSITVVE